MSNNLPIAINSDVVSRSQSFLIQFLKDAGFTGDINPGSAIYDIIIKPMSLLYSLFTNITEKTKAYSSINYATSIRESLTKTEYDTIIDQILSNWFVVRKDGIKSIVKVRLYFSKAVDYLDLSPSNTVITINGIGFVPVVQNILSPGVFEQVYNTSRYSVEYFYDITLNTVDNVEFNVTDVNNISILNSIPSVYFLRAQYVDTIQIGYERESSENFIDRTDKVITTREMITPRAIRTILNDLYGEVKSLYIAGCMAPELYRDMIIMDKDTRYETALHICNRADVYIALPLQSATQTLICEYDTDSDTYYANKTDPIENHIVDTISVKDIRASKGSLIFKFTNKPTENIVITTTDNFYPTKAESNTIYPLLHVVVNKTITPDDYLIYGTQLNPKYYYTVVPMVSDILVDSLYPLVLPSEEDNYQCSNSELFTDFSLNSISASDDFEFQDVEHALVMDDDFHFGTVGKNYILQIPKYTENMPTTLEFVYITNQLYSEINTLLTKSVNRVVCYDPIVKSKYTIRFKIKLNVTIPEGITTDYEHECKKAIINYYNNIKNIDMFTVFDLIGNIYNDAKSIKVVHLPINIVAYFRDPISYSLGEYIVPEDFSVQLMLNALGFTNRQVTLNTVQWYIGYDDIDLVVVNTIR